MQISAKVTGGIAPVESSHEVKLPKEPTIVTLTPFYLPGYKAGGPIRSIANLAAALGPEFHFKIVTLDRDLGDKSRSRRYVE